MIHPTQIKSQPFRLQTHNQLHKVVNRLIVKRLATPPSNGRICPFPEKRGFSQGTIHTSHKNSWPLRLQNHPIQLYSSSLVVYSQSFESETSASSFETFSILCARPETFSDPITKVGLG